MKPYPLVKSLAEYNVKKHRTRNQQCPLLSKKEMVSNFLRCTKKSALCRTVGECFKAACALSPMYCVYKNDTT